MAQPATSPSYGTNPAMRDDTRVVGHGTGDHGAGNDEHGGKSLRERAEEAASEAKAKAAQLGEDASEAARAEATAAADRARALAEQVQAEARSFTDQAVNRVKDTAESAIEQQRDRAAGFVGSIERAVGAAARSLDEDGYGTMASYVRYASSTLSSVNREVEGFRPQTLTGPVERTARRNPLVTYGALAVAGFALVTLMNSQDRR